METGKLSFRELHGIERDPRWPHVEGCMGVAGCMGCILEDAVLASGGTAGRDWLFENMSLVVKNNVIENVVSHTAPPITDVHVGPQSRPKPRKAK